MRHQQTARLKRSPDTRSVYYEVFHPPPPCESTALVRATVRVVSVPMSCFALLKLRPLRQLSAVLVHPGALPTKPHGEASKDLLQHEQDRLCVVQAPWPSGAPVTVPTGRHRPPSLPPTAARHPTPSPLHETERERERERPAPASNSETRAVLEATGVTTPPPPVPSPKLRYHLQTTGNHVTKCRYASDL